MEQYIVSARKYRPSSFSTVVGQEALTGTLKNAIATGHLAHAYLFCGSRGVGKTSCARIFAKAINCTNPGSDGEACNECESCRAFNEGSSMNIIEFDAASNNGVDDIRNVIEQVQIPPALGRYRVFIIDEVHMLSAQAFNAFLKTLEEPPSYVIFILATTEKHKIIPTILSRCQIYDFSRITINDMVRHLEKVAASEGVTAEKSALNVIAHQADGAMRDALSIFDQVAASCRGNITYARTIEALNVLDSSHYNKLLDCIVTGDIPGALLVFNGIRRQGFDGQFFVSGLGAYLRSLMLAGNERTRGLLDEPDDVVEGLVAAAAKVTPEFIYKALSLCNETDLNYRQSSNKQLLVELLLIKIAQLLNPSPAESGRGEGSLKPITAASVQATAGAAPQSSPVATATTVTTTVPAAAADQAPQPASAATHRFAPRPAAQPRPAARSGAPLRPGGALRPGALSMSARAATTESQQCGKSRHETVTQSSLEAAWRSYIEAHATEHALLNIMRACAPALREGNRAELVLPNDVEAAKISENLPSILPWLQQQVSNYSFMLELSVHDQGLLPMFWNEQQVLTHILENHEKFRDFYRAMKLSLL